MDEVLSSVNNRNKYVLDNDAQKRIIKFLSMDDIDDDSKEKFLAFLNVYVVQNVPQELFGEYFKNHKTVCTSYSNSSVQVGEDTFSYDGNSVRLVYNTGKNRGCSNLEIQNWVVHRAEIEGIVFCIKNEYSFVTDDEKARQLCEVLAVRSFSTKKLLQDSGFGVHKNFNQVIKELYGKR